MNASNRSHRSIAHVRGSRGLRVLALGLVLAISIAACGSSSDDTDGDTGGATLTISDAWSRQPADGAVATAIYGVVTNPGDDDITITGVSSPVTEIAELHETLIDDDGVASMQEREDGFVVPAGGSFVFEPGGPHVMLMQIDSSTYPDEVEFTLEFDDADPLTAAAEVRAVTGSMGDMSHGDSDDMDSDDMDGEGMDDDATGS